MTKEKEPLKEKKAVKFCTVPVFNEIQLDKQVAKQVRFLKAIYPFLEDEENWNEGCIELRPLKRDGDIKGYIRSYNAWHMQEKDIEALKKFLGMLNGKGFCLYYSIFAFDYKKEVSRNGKIYEKGKINNENAMFTTVLVMDFDNITSEEFKKEKQKLIDLDIETIDIFTGHGFQSIILLSEKVTDKEILKKFTNLMLAKGFKVDEALVDPARVGREPYSFNCKALDKKSKYYDEFVTEIFATTDVAWTDKRYHIVDVFEKINSMKDVIPQIKELTHIDIKSITTAPITKTEQKKQVAQKNETNKIKIENLKHVYHMIKYEKLPEPIKHMLSGSRDGYRNQVVLFLIPFLRNSLGLNIQTIKQVMTLWGERCIPNLDQSFVEVEVNRVYEYGFKSKFGKYTEKLVSEYGFLEFTKYTRLNKIVIPNAIFDDFDVISDGAVRIYLALKLAESIDGITEFTKKDIQKYANIGERTIERNIKHIVNMGYICKRRTNRRMKEEYVYSINTHFSVTAGFTMLENSVVTLMLIQLTDGEMKVYSYLCRMVSDAKNDCWASQKYIAKQVRKTQQGVALITEKLMEKKYINKKTEEKNGFKHCIYNLNY
jgi:hypothetical protein